MVNLRSRCALWGSVLVEVLMSAHERVACTLAEYGAWGATALRALVEYESSSIMPIWRKVDVALYSLEAPSAIVHSKLCSAKVGVGAHWKRGVIISCRGASERHWPFR